MDLSLKTMDGLGLSTYCSLKIVWFIIEDLLVQLIVLITVYQLMIQVPLKQEETASFSFGGMRFHQ